MKLKYPKLLLLLLTFLLAYLVFSGKNFLPFRNFLLSLGYFGTFLFGIFYIYSFTAAPATAMLLILSKDQNVFLAGILAGIGALIGDLIIFKFIRSVFSNEIERLSKNKFIKYVNKKIPISLKKYLIPVIASIIIASPLPDEIGVSLFAFHKRISMTTFSIISFLLNTIGIFVVLLIGKFIL